MSTSASSNNHRRAICIYFQPQLSLAYSNKGPDGDQINSVFTGSSRVLLKKAPIEEASSTDDIDSNVFDMLNGNGFIKTSEKFDINETLTALPAEIVMALLLSRMSKGLNRPPQVPHADNMVIALPYSALSPARQQLKTALEIAGWNVDPVFISNTTATALAFAEKCPKFISSKLPAATTLLSVFSMRNYLEVAVIEVTSTTCKCLAVQVDPRVYRFSELLKALRNELRMDERAFNDKIRAVAVVTEMQVGKFSKTRDMIVWPMYGLFRFVKSKFPGKKFWFEEDASKTLIMNEAVPGMMRLALEPELRSNIQERWPWTLKVDPMVSWELPLDANSVAKDYKKTFGVGYVVGPKDQLVVYQNLCGESKEVAKVVKLDELMSNCRCASITLSIDRDGIIKLKVDTKSRNEYKPKLKLAHLPPDDQNAVNAAREVVAFIEHSEWN